MPAPQDAYASLVQDPLFKNWQKQHKQVFLSHFFCRLSDKLVVTGSWETGYFDASREKITIFVELKEKAFEIKPEDDVFKEKSAVIEELNLKTVNVPWEKAMALFKEQCSLLFPKEQITEGFVILQTLNHKSVWNFVFMTRSVQYLNIKIDAEKGTVDSHQLLNVIHREG